MIRATIGKFWAEFWTHKFGFGIIIIAPIMMLLVSSLITNQIADQIADGDTAITYDLAIINKDLGLPAPTNDIETIFYASLPIEWQEYGVGKVLSDSIFDLQYQENFLFNQVNITIDDAITSVEDKEVALVVIIPEKFTQLVLDLMDNAIDEIDLSLNVSLTITMYGNSEDPNSQVAESIVRSVIDMLLEAMSSGSSSTADSISITQEYVLPRDIRPSFFDLNVISICMTTSVLAAAGFTAFLNDDFEKGTIIRIKLSPNSPSEYLFGFTIWSFMVALVTFILYFTVAIFILDFDPPGSFLRAFITLLILNFASLGLTFTAISVSKSSSATALVLAAVAYLVYFITIGVFTITSEIVLVRDILSFTSGSPDLRLLDILPWTHGANALRGIFVYDKTFSEISGDMILLTAMSLIWFVLGLYLFTKRRFARDT